MEPEDEPRGSEDLECGKRESFLLKLLRKGNSKGSQDIQFHKKERIPLKEFTDRKDSLQERSASKEKHEENVSKAHLVSSAKKDSKPSVGGSMRERWKKTGNVTRFVHRLQREVNVQREVAAQTFSDDFAHDGKHDRSKITDESHNIQRGFQFGDKYSQGYPGMDDNPEEDINDIVDTDDHRIEEFVSHHLVGHFVNSMQFRVLIFVLIILNSLLIGLQTDKEIAVKWRYLFMMFDQIVMAIFICEILLKWHYGFWIFWKDGWNILDFVLIIGMVLAPEVEFLSSNLNLRILRVFRAFRSLRSVGALAGLSMVAQTCISSIPDMANIGMLLGIIILVFGVMGTTLFATMLPARFADLPTAMFSLFICVTQDGWVEIYQEFRDQGTTAHIGGCVYLFFWIMIGAFVFANLVVAVVVTNLERAMKEFAEERSAQNALAASSGTAYDGDFSGSNTEKTNIVEYRDNIRNNVDLLQQSPFELSTLRGLSSEKLEKYLMLLTVFEENLVEYQQLRRDLCQVYDVVRTLNAVMEEEIYTEAEEIDTVLKVPFVGMDFTKGDIMSNLMKIKDKTVFSDKFQQYL